MTHPTELFCTYTAPDVQICFTIPWLTHLKRNTLLCSEEPKHPDRMNELMCLSGSQVLEIMCKGCITGIQYRILTQDSCIPQQLSESPGRQNKYISSG